MRLLRSEVVERKIFLSTFSTADRRTRHRRRNLPHMIVDVDSNACNVCYCKQVRVIGAYDKTIEVGRD